MEDDAIRGLTVIKDGTFPAPIKLGPKASGWLVSEVQNWIAERVSARPAK